LSTKTKALKHFYGHIIFDELKTIGTTHLLLCDITKQTETRVIDHYMNLFPFSWGKFHSAFRLTKYFPNFSKTISNND